MAAEKHEKDHWAKVHFLPARPINPGFKPWVTQNKSLPVLAKLVAIYFKTVTNNHNSRRHFILPRLFPEQHSGACYLPAG